MNRIRQKPAQRSGLWILVLWLITLSGLFIFQSSQDVSFSKIGYGIFFVGLSLFALASLRLSDFAGARKAVGTLLSITLICFAYLALRLIAGPITLIELRASVPYFLLVAAIPLGLFLGSRITPNQIQFAIVSVGVVSATLTFTDWIDRRGVLDLGEKTGLASAVLPALAFSLCIWKSFNSASKRSSFGFASIAIVILWLMLATGTRTNLTFLFGFLPLVALALQKRQTGIGIGDISTSLPKVMATLLSVIFVGALSFMLSSYLGIDNFILNRLVNLSQIALVDAYADQSFVARSLAYNYGVLLFNQSPLFGLGFGSTPFVFDTPFSGLVKLGVLGYICLLAIFVVLYRLSRSSKVYQTPARLGFDGWLLILIGLLPFGTIFEDKGTAISILFVTASFVATPIFDTAGPRSWTTKI